MKIIGVHIHVRGDGREITDELQKHPGWTVEAVFPLGHVFFSENHQDFLILIKPPD